MVSASGGILSLYVSLKTKVSLPAAKSTTLNFPISTGKIYEFRTMDGNGKTWYCYVNNNVIQFNTSAAVPEGTWIRFLMTVPF